MTRCRTGAGRGAIAAAALLLGGCADFDATRFFQNVGAHWCENAANCDLYEQDAPQGPLTAYDRGLHRSATLVPGSVAARRGSHTAVGDAALDAPLR